MAWVWAAAYGLFYRDQTLGLRSVGLHTYKVRREAVVYLEYPRLLQDANSLQTSAVGLLFAANDKIDFSKGSGIAQPPCLWELWRNAENKALTGRSFAGLPVRI